MIAYRLRQAIDPAAAAQCLHPALERLRGRGPWTAQATAEGVVLSRGEAAAWGPWQAGLGGLEYRLADPLPACDPAALVRPGLDGQGEPVALRCGVTLPVRPAAWDGQAIGLDGSLGGPVSMYGRAVAALYDRCVGGDDPPPTDPQALEVARMALMSCTTLTAELIHAWGLLTTTDVAVLFAAAADLPKAGAGAGPCSAESPASIPPG